MHAHSGSEEKQHAATSSVVAALGLTGFKIIIGFSTGSLGILAEAAHSGLDLMAALMTAFAVKFSDKPADTCHPYGHGKIENLSALFETVLLLVTCAWILWAAGERILTGELDIEVNVWAFIVMATSIVVDISRSRMLYAAAKKYNSQALEADALHFKTDIWSSSVVMLGLLCVKLHDWYPAYDVFKYADSAAAIIVALIAIKVSLSLGKRAIDALLDSSPEKGIEDKIKQAVDEIPGANHCHQIRIRYSGAQTFIDLHVLMDGQISLQKAHALTEVIENKLETLFPKADITVHPEPK